MVTRNKQFKQSPEQRAATLSRVRLHRANRRKAAADAALAIATDPPNCPHCGRVLMLGGDIGGPVYWECIRRSANDHRCTIDLATADPANVNPLGENYRQLYVGPTNG